MPWVLIYNTLRGIAPAKTMTDMKRIFLLLTLLATTLYAAAQTLSVASYNIRYANSNDAKAGNSWWERAPRIASLVNYEAWDVVGMQEVLHAQLQDLRKGLKDYDYVGVGREDGATKGEYVPIFYKKSRLKCLKQGTFWLSETPEEVGSKGWDAALPRVCTWACFEDKVTQWKLWVFNLHLDHVGKEARVKSARLVLKQIAKLCGDEPYVLTGDFNADQHSDVYASLLKSDDFVDAFDRARHRMAENGTFNGFKPQSWKAERIDHVFVSKHFNVHRYGLLTPFYWAQTPDGDYQPRHYSDHFPVSTVLELPQRCEAEE